MFDCLDIPAVKNISQLSVILYLLTALAWALVGFVWIFGAQQIENQNCGHDSNTYWVGQLFQNWEFLIKNTDFFLVRIRFTDRTEWSDGCLDLF